MKRAGAATLSLLLLAVALLLAPDALFTASAANPAQVVATPAPAPACPLGSAACAGGPSPTPSGPEPTATPSLPKAANSGLKMMIEAGMGQEGYVRGATWFPVYINLENSGSNINGEVVINVAPGLQNLYGQQVVPLYTSLYVQPVELARGAKKQLTMYVPYPANELFTRSVTVELNGLQEGDDGPRNLAIASAEVKPLLNQLLVGYFSPNPDALRAYEDLILGSNQNTNTYGKGAPVKHLRVTPLEASHLPDISQALGSLDILVLQDFDAGNLNEGQWSAVESWVRQGGVLLLSGGTSAGRVLKNLPANLQPASLPNPDDYTEIDQASLDALAKLGNNPVPEGATNARSYLARLKPADGATSLMTGGNGLPLALELKRGAGAIIMTAFDLTEPRFTNWSGGPELWEMLVGRYQNALQQFGPYSAYGLNSGNPLAGGLSNVLTNIPGVGIPSLKVIAALVLIYIAIVGPGNFLVLKFLRRLELSWITLPLLTALFAGGIYLFALKDKGNELLTSSVSIVRLTENDNQGKGPLEKPAIALTGIFTPNDNSYVLSLPANSLTSAVPNLMPYGQFQIPQGPGQFPATPPPTLPPAPAAPVGLRIVQGSQPKVELLNMSQWSFRSVVVEGNVKLQGGLSGRFVQNDGKLSGSLTNNTGRPLSDVTVLTAFGMAQLGNLAPGQTVPVEFENTFGAPSPLYSLYQGNPAQYYRAVPPPTQQNSSPEERAQARKREVVNNISGALPYFNPGGYNPNYQGQGGSSGVVALAWSDQPLLDYAVNGRTIGGNDLTLLVSELSLDMSRSNQLLPGLLLGQVSDKTVIPVASPGATQNGQGSYLPPAPISGASLQAGSVTVEFEAAQLAKALQSGDKKLDKLVIESPAYSFNLTGYGPQQAARYNFELYNYRTGRWDTLPVVLAPEACYKQIPAYNGGPVSAPMSAMNSPGQGASQSCLNGYGKGYPGPTPTPTPASAGGKGAIPPPTATLQPGAKGSGPTGVPTATPIPTNVPAYFPGGAASGFVVLAPGPDFDPMQYIGPDGKIRARYTRDDKSTDVVYWNYFSVGYELK